MASSARGPNVPRREILANLLRGSLLLTVGTWRGHRAARSVRHPSLFFGLGDFSALRDKCHGDMTPQFEVLTRYGENHRADIPPSTLEGGYETKGDVIQSVFLTNILDFSFLYVVTRDAAYLDAAKRWALTLARMPAWAGELYEGVAAATAAIQKAAVVTALAVAYDWLYPVLDEDERALLVQRIALLSGILYRATDGGEWWTSAYLHHDGLIPIGGLGVGALSVIDEVPEANRWADRAAREFDNALDWLDDDGAWPEGPAGWAFAMAAAAPFWAAYARVHPDRSSAIFERPWLRETWKFRLYSRTPTGLFLGFGDSAPHGGYQWTGYEAGPILRLLADVHQNATAQWLAEREWEPRPNPFTAVWEILWADPALPATAPDALPVGAWFENQQIAILRPASQRRHGPWLSLRQPPGHPGRIPCHRRHPRALQQLDDPHPRRRQRLRPLLPRPVRDHPCPIRSTGD